jgi:hypothetical protein
MDMLQCGRRGRTEEVRPVIVWIVTYAMRSPCVRPTLVVDSLHRTQAAAMRVRKRLVRDPKFGERGEYDEVVVWGKRLPPARRSRKGRPR